MWTCNKCQRVFARTNNPHSCKSVPIESHFKNKDLARELFYYLLTQIETKIGKCKIISLPCCIHLFGSYDFLAALPKKDRLEIRIGLNRKLDSPRVKIAIPTSAKSFKVCFDIYTKEEIDTELQAWITEAFHLNDKI